MKIFLKCTLAFLIILTSVLNVKAQTNISGVVNGYAPVTAINGAKIILTIGTTVGTGSFTAGNKILVMQMKGATIDASEGNTYGQILNQNDAGNFEWANIASISGSNITLTNALTQNYTVSGLVQIVRVPLYSTGATVLPANLTGLAWNGSAGGILAIEVVGTLRLNGNITMNGMGSRGGAFSTPSGNCSITTYRTTSTQLGYKGEGIAIEPNNNLNGRGALANGGGGGNGHNAGGGGGSNAGQGGVGGREWAGPLIGGWCGVQDGTCNNNNNTVGGVGGYIVTPSNKQKYFMGGGGGGGQQDNNVSSSGGNGGGIIFILGNTIDANGVNRVISANGSAALNASHDGAGGGGSGGTIGIKATNFLSNISVQATGGNGGNTTSCHGPGGGGGGGYIQFTANMVGFANVTTSAIAGANGTQPAGATCGSPSVAVGNNFCGTVSAFSAGTVVNQTPLPISLVTFTGAYKDNQNQLWWQTAQEINNAYFVIEHSKNNLTFATLGKVEGNGNSTGLQEYHFTHENPAQGLNYYRLKQVDWNGTFSYSPIVAIYTEFDTKLTVFPNPSDIGKINLKLTGNPLDAKGHWLIQDMQGRELTKAQTFEGLEQEISTEALPKGVYILIVHTTASIWQKKIVLTK